MKILGDRPFYVLSVHREKTFGIKLFTNCLVRLSSFNHNRFKWNTSERLTYIQRIVILNGNQMNFILQTFYSSAGE